MVFAHPFPMCKVMESMRPVMPSGYHVAVIGIYTRNIFLLGAHAQVEIYVVFSGNLVQFLKESRKTFKSDIGLLQNAVDEDGFDVVVAGCHAVKETYEFFECEDIWIICHTDHADIERGKEGGK